MTQNTVVYMELDTVSQTPWRKHGEIFMKILNTKFKLYTSINVLKYIKYYY
jgi:hypothetical protein